MTTYSSTLPSVPTIGEIPLLFGRLSARLHARQLIGEPRLKLKKEKPETNKIESET